MCLLALVGRRKPGTRRRQLAVRDALACEKTSEEGCTRAWSLPRTGSTVLLLVLLLSAPATGRGDQRHSCWLDLTCLCWPATTSVANYLLPLTATTTATKNITHLWYSDCYTIKCFYRTINRRPHPYLYGDLGGHCCVLAAKAELNWLNKCKSKKLKEVRNHRFCKMFVHCAVFRGHVSFGSIELLSWLGSV